LILQQTQTFDQSKAKPAEPNREQRRDNHNAEQPRVELNETSAGDGLCTFVRSLTALCPNHRGGPNDSPLYHQWPPRLYHQWPPRWGCRHRVGPTICGPCPSHSVSPGPPRRALLAGRNRSTRQRLPWSAPGSIGWRARHWRRRSKTGADWCRKLNNTVDVARRCARRRLRHWQKPHASRRGTHPSRCLMLAVQRLALFGFPPSRLRRERAFNVTNLSVCLVLWWSVAMDSRGPLRITGDHDTGAT
jgi:hypothetical protein